MLPRGAAKNEAPRRPRYFSARASRAARRRFEDEPRTFGQGWLVIPKGLRTPVRPHCTRQQPRLSCVPIVFDYILIQGCKSKKLCRAASSKRRQIHAAARNARKLPRAMKTAPTRRKRKNPFPDARARSPKRAAAKRAGARSFYKPFAERGKSRENMRRHMTIKKAPRLRSAL